MRRAGGMESMLTYMFWPLGVMLHSGKMRQDLVVFFYCHHPLCFLSLSSRQPFYSSFNQFHFSPLTSKCGSSCQVARETTVARQHTTLHHPFQKSDRWRTGMPRQEWGGKKNENEEGGHRRQRESKKMAKRSSIPKWSPVCLDLTLRWTRGICRPPRNRQP